jgi:hypothetical protein
MRFPRRKMQVMRLDHLRRSADEVYVALPEGWPDQLPLLYSEDEELHRPEERPGAVREISK